MMDTKQYLLAWHKNGDDLNIIEHKNRLSL